MQRCSHAVISVFILCAMLSVVSGCARSGSAVKAEPFGTADGRPVTLYTLANSRGSRASITDYGATVTQLWLADRDGNLADVVLGFDTLDEYQDHSPYFGAMVGRVGNRVAEGRFTLDGKTYQLATNNGPNHLHGGDKGFDKVVWDAEPFQAEDGPGLRLTYVSPDGEEGYPGRLRTTVEYVLSDDDELRVVTEATASAATPVNIVHHSYWNLAGHDAGTILDHELVLRASHYTPTDATMIPTGEIASVRGTPFDFTNAKTIGRDIGQLPGDGAGDPGGFDMNFVVDGGADEFRLAARVVEPITGRVMEVWSDQPGIQFYSGNFLDGTPGKRGASYPIHSGLCLETQVFPDAINRQGEPGWPNTVLRPGQIYRHKMVHRFSVE
ncbi:MAG: galactose mutarotase [Planctomycetota bacterium]|nr:MAG: galactose mutarotase [Planctomycetota bacterium]